MSDNVVKFIGIEDVDLITTRVERIHAEHKYDLETCLGLVLMNYGQRYVKVKCVAGEWEGTKGDLEPGPGIPKCPNGHVLLETSDAPRLALVKE